MVRTFIYMAGLMLAAPAIAQTAAPADDAASSPANSVAAIVDSEFPAYDADKSGQLEKAEFGKWMMALKNEEMKASGKSLPAAEVTAWADGAFLTADTDKSSTVSKEELVAYLGGAA